MIDCGEILCGEDVEVEVEEDSWTEFAPSDFCNPPPL